MRMMKFPSRVKIGPYVFSVHFSKEVVKKRAKKHADQCYGITSFDLLEIAVLPTGNTIEQESYLHEILHGVFFATHLGLKVNHKLEEEIISAISPVLMGVLRSNPDTVKFLLGRNEL